jgi:hypothetical protein
MFGTYQGASAIMRKTLDWKHSGICVSVLHSFTQIYMNLNLVKHEDNSFLCHLTRIGLFFLSFSLSFFLFIFFIFYYICTSVYVLLEVEIYVMHYVRHSVSIWHLQLSSVHVTTFCVGGIVVVHWMQVEDSYMTWNVDLMKMHEYCSKNFAEVDINYIPPK